MATQFDHTISPEEYLAIEREAEYKSEYVHGVLYAMAGTSREHNVVVANLIAELHGNLRGKRYTVFPSDMKVRLPDTTRFYYPDVSIACGDELFADDRRDVLLNPVVVIEVLSDSTAAYDRGKKFQGYQQIPSLREYLLVAQDEPVVEQYVRQSNDSWLYTRIAGLDSTVELASIGCRVALRDIYAKVLQ